MIIYYVKKNNYGILRFANLISAFRQDNFNSLTSSPLSVRKHIYYYFLNKLLIRPIKIMV